MEKEDKILYSVLAILVLAAVLCWTYSESLKAEQIKRASEQEFKVWIELIKKCGAQVGY